MRNDGISINAWRLKPYATLDWLHFRKVSILNVRMATHTFFGRGHLAYNVKQYPTSDSHIAPAAGEAGFPPDEFAAMQHDSANYIAEMILQLRTIAAAAKLSRVLIPLEFAFYEASAAEYKVDVPPEEAERIARISRVDER